MLEKYFNNYLFKCGGTDVLKAFINKISFKVLNFTHCGNEYLRPTVFGKCKNFNTKDLYMEH